MWEKRFSHTFFDQPGRTTSKQPKTEKSRALELTIDETP